MFGTMKSPVICSPTVLLYSSQLLLPTKAQFLQNDIELEKGKKSTSDVELFTISSLTTSFNRLIDRCVYYD
jgi:hypothetical protein